MLNEVIVERAVAEIGKGYAEYQYFFDNLASPAWLDPLAQRRLFSEPPAPVPVGDRGIRLPFWPASRYLIRMAERPDAQGTVARIARGIPKTDNSRVYDDLIEIALRLPPMLAGGLVPQIADGFKRLRGWMLLPGRLGDLIARIAQPGTMNEAKALTLATLSVEIGSESARGTGPSDDFNYAQIVSKAAPALAAQDATQAVAIFADILDGVLAASMSVEETAVGTEDYLYISHEVIDAPPAQYEVRAVVFCALRGLAIDAIKRDPESFGAITGVLATKRWSSFRRLELYLAHLFLEPYGLRAAEVAFRTPEILGDAGLRREANVLLNDAFPTLPTETQHAVLTWMDTPPSDESIQRWLAFVQQELSSENIRKLACISRRDHLAILQGMLPPPYSEALAELVREYGPPVNNDGPRITGGAIGPVSPVADDELASKNVDEVITYLKTWRPAEGFFEASIDGLARSLGAEVSRRPREFATSATRFIGLDPSYLHQLFQGLRLSLERAEHFDWHPVLEAAAWVAHQPRQIAGRKGGLLDKDPDWGWTRDAILDLVIAGFKAANPVQVQVPIAMRAAVWNVLRELANDPLPRPEDERSENFDPGFRSINSTRGRAMFAIVDYARWLKLGSAGGDGENASDVSFAAMPEVRELLDAHLDVGNEPTLTIRSIYGQTLNMLHWLDPEWTSGHLEHIFPLCAQEAPRFLAAWRSYICFDHPNPALLPSLIPFYRNALAHISDETSHRTSSRSPADALGEHLVVFFGRGKLDLQGDDGLLAEFYRVAPDAVRGHAMWFIGSVAAEWSKQAAGVIGRLEGLIDGRIEECRRAADRTSFAAELSMFGHCFISGAFSAAWSIRALLAALRLVPKSVPDMFVVQRIAAMAAEHPGEAIECLALLIGGDEDGWMLVGVETEARAIIRMGLQAAEPDVAIRARRLAERIIEMGNLGFRTVFE